MTSCSGRDDLSHPAVQALLGVMQSEAFRAALDALGGYDTTGLGQKL